MQINESYTPGTIIKPAWGLSKRHSGACEVTLFCLTVLLFLPSFQLGPHVLKIQTQLSMVTVSQTIVNSAVNLKYTLPARPNCMWARSYLHCINSCSSSFYSAARINFLCSLLLSFGRAPRHYAAKSADLQNTWVQALCSASQRKCSQETSITTAPIIMAVSFGTCTVCINIEWYLCSKQNKYLTIISLWEAVLITQIFYPAQTLGCMKSTLFEFGLCCRTVTAGEDIRSFILMLASHMSPGTVNRETSYLTFRSHLPERSSSPTMRYTSMFRRQCVHYTALL